MEYEAIVSSVTVVQKGRSIISEGATKIEVADEGGGEFIEISQCESDTQKIRIDREEWPVIRAAVDEMIGRLRE
jgi:hypothetical protein